VAAVVLVATSSCKSWRQRQAAGATRESRGASRRGDRRAQAAAQQAQEAQAKLAEVQQAADAPRPRRPPGRGATMRCCSKSSGW